MRLLIDDIRELPCDRVARTFDEGKNWLAIQAWDEVWFDHDLGEKEDGRNGYALLSYLLEESNQPKPKFIRLVTSNPAGRANMILALTQHRYRVIDQYNHLYLYDPTAY